MFDIAWTEMIVIALITIVVVGPRDLPKVMKTIASFVAKVRSFSSKFQSDMDALARETELDDLRKQARAYQATLQNPTRALDQLVDPETGEAVRKPIDVSKLVVAGDGKSSGMPSLSEQATVRAPAEVVAVRPDEAEAKASEPEAETAEDTEETGVVEPAPGAEKIAVPEGVNPEETEDGDVTVSDPARSGSDAEVEDVSVSDGPRKKGGGGRG